ncbi:MAG TPA: hypothetical protein V6D14_34980 [Coleofasciculaceae cyanobacterium]
MASLINHFLLPAVLVASHSSHATVIGVSTDSDFFCIGEIAQ